MTSPERQESCERRAGGTVLRAATVVPAFFNGAGRTQEHGSFDGGGSL
ncbi:MAG: hypothetical protein QOC99_1891 [Acidobacteriota bacterium]|jgi:hypothetical protein|nr:hypothetical protein [Acidobacteriota bacterium]